MLKRSDGHNASRINNESANTHARSCAHAYVSIRAKTQVCTHAIKHTMPTRLHVHAHEGTCSCKHHMDACTCECIHA